MKRVYVIIRYAWFDDDRRGSYCGVLEWRNRDTRRGFSELGFNVCAPMRIWAEFDSRAAALDALGSDLMHPHMHHEVIERSLVDERHATRCGHRDYCYTYVSELHLMYTATA